MRVDDIKRTFHQPSRAAYPELEGYSREEIYSGKMGPGALYLAAQMARCLCFCGGERVLDLGCGMGATSVFLAKHYNVHVVAVDLWISATDLHQRFLRERVADQVVPLNLDITGPLPFACDYFDAVFCMDSIHYYGGKEPFWHHILPHLKPGGRFCIGSPCFSEEFSADALAHLPQVFDNGTDLWPREFSRYHSPLWWDSLLGQTGLMCNISSTELEDGIVFWEDDIVYNLEQGGDAETASRDADQCTFRQAGMPYLTHFVLCAERNRCGLAK